MEKATTENLQNSPDLKIEAEEKSKQKDSGLDERSPTWGQPDSLTISLESDSESMAYTTSSDSSEISYSYFVDSPPLAVVPISFIEPEDFNESDEKTMPTEHRPLKMVGVGMCNLGNTCFLNAVVQCFMHSVVLLQLLASFDHVSPCDNPRDNIVKKAFGGHLVSMLRCFNCCHLSVTPEPLIDLSLEIVDVDSVPKALESFTKIENIEFSSEKCKTQGPFEKQLLIDRAPSIATLCLKRFINDGFDVQKVDKHVSFPLELDMFHYTNMKELVLEEMKYDLCAVIVHSGFSISSGHYYSFIRCNPNEWYKFDDEQVHWVHEDRVLEEQAYILFYTKRHSLWFTNYTQIHKPFVNLVIPSTSSCIPNNHALDVGESNHAADDTSPKATPNKRIKGDY
ncbi:hypothetical protein EJD97_003463 [Solanum chilense]|uniref:Ubiquitin carboxyl-terminal hydrolase n=1 Tax=Solanum chilense TaxID=4083 RepID=A0A6N2CJW4_SOLCI|nr:hypothetical protein EJD97_003463 [Solanum chilense]